MATVNPDRLRITMVGTRGVLTHYGGFETTIREAGRHLADHGHRVLVYCRNPEPDIPLPSTYLGIQLVELSSVKSRSLETLSRMALSVTHLLRHTHPDAAFVFNAANSLFLPVLRTTRIPVTTCVDGLEQRRGKWGPTGKRYYHAAEALAVRHSDALIADTQGTADYYTEEFNAPTDLLAYRIPCISADTSHPAEPDLSPKGFHLVVARFEVENRVDVIVEGYMRSEATLPLVVVGSTPYADGYAARIEFLADGRVRLLGGLWDRDLLDALYSGTLVYFRDHSVGGANPSLLRTIGAGAVVNAFDVSFSREVLGKVDRYWTTPDEVAALVVSAESDIEAQSARDGESRKCAALYDWDEMASSYGALTQRLAFEGPARRRPSGRRTGRVG